MLWIQLLAGPITWSVHFVLSYLPVEAFSQTGMGGRVFAIVLSLLSIGLTLLALAIPGFYGWRIYRGRREMDPEVGLGDIARTPAHHAEGPVEFIHLPSLMPGILFAVTVLMLGIPILFLVPCG